MYGYDWRQLIRGFQSGISKTALGSPFTLSCFQMRFFVYSKTKNALQKITERIDL